MNHWKNEIEEYLRERKWDGQLKRPGHIAKSIVLEAAEILEIFQWKEFTDRDIKSDNKLYQSAKDELADVLIYCTEFALALDIDVDKAVRDKLEKVKKKYPLYVGNDQDEYLRIKQEHRINKK